MSLPLFGDLRQYNEQDAGARERIRIFTLQLLPPLLHGAYVVLAEGYDYGMADDQLFGDERAGVHTIARDLLVRACACHWQLCCPAHLFPCQALALQVRACACHRQLHCPARLFSCQALAICVYPVSGECVMVQDRALVS